MPTEFGEWLKAELAKRGWSMRQLALRSGIHPAAVTNIVRTGGTPRMETTLKMAEALGEDPAVMLRLAGLVPTFVPETQTKRTYCVSSALCLTIFARQ